MTRSYEEMRDRMVLERAGESVPEYQGSVYARSEVVYASVSQAELAERGTVSIPTYFEFLSFLPAGSYIAGGSVATAFVGRYMSPDQDIDVFFKDVATLELARARLLAQGYKYLPDSPGGTEIFVPNSETLGTKPFNPVQLIILAFFTDAEHLIDGFDWTVTQFAIDMGTKRVHFNPMGVLDLSRWSLVVHRSESDNSFIKRVRKYRKKGFRLVGQAKARWETIPGHEHL